MARVIDQAGRQQQHAEQHGPAARACPCRITDRAQGAYRDQSICRVFEQHPDGGQIGRAVARGDVAPVDDACDDAGFDQHVARVQIAVDPRRRDIDRRRERELPDAQNGRTDRVRRFIEPMDADLEGLDPVREQRDVL